MSRPQESTAVHVARGAFYILTQNAASNIMMIVSFAILARLITPLEMGEMAVLLMIIEASRVIVCLGMSNSVTVLIAGSMAKDDRVAATGVFYQSIRTSLLLSLPVGTALFCLAGFLSTQLLHTPGEAMLFQLLALDIVVAGLLPILNSAMLGLQKIREMSVINLAYMATRQSLIVVFTFVTRSLLGLVMAWVVSELAVTLAFLGYVRSNLGPPAFTFDLKRLVRFSFPLFLQEVTQYVYAWFDRVTLLTYLSLEGLGVYTTSITAFGVLAGVASAIGTSLFPIYSAMQEEHGNEALSDSIRGASRYVCLIVVPLCFGLFSTAKPSLAFFVGEAYAEGTGPLMILSLFLAFTLVRTALTGILVVLRHTVLSLELTVLDILFGVASTLVLLPSLGMIGASIARGITMVTGLVTVMVALRHRISVRFDTETLWKTLLSSGVMATAVLLVQAYYYNKYLLPAYVVVGGFIYFSMLLILHAIKAQDIQLLDRYLGPRFRFIARPLKWLVAIPSRDVSDS
jgi:O-antigen/teichoic acid export membrane protein